MRMVIVGLVGFAGIVVFSLLYVVFLLKRASLKIPVIGMVVFALVIAASILFTQMGIMMPEGSTTGEPPEGSPADGQSSGPIPTLTLISEPALTSAFVPEGAAPTAAVPEGAAPAAAPASAPATVQELERFLIGGWSNAHRTENRIVTSIIVFFAGGYLEVGGGIYDNIHTFYHPEIETDILPEDEYGWFQQHQNMGLLGDNGNYSLAALGNGRFVLKEDLSSFSDIFTSELTYVNDNTIRIDGETYVRGSNYTLAQLAKIFGFAIEVEAAADTPADEFKRILTGSWSSASRVGDELHTSYFNFSAAGEIETGGFIYINKYNSADFYWEEGDEYGWFVAPMGHPSFYGNYSLTALGNSRFALKAVGEWTDAGPVDSVYDLTYMDNNTIRIDGETYVRGNYTLAELARIFGFDIEA